MIGGSKNVIKDGSEFYQTLDKRAFISGGMRAPTGGNTINMQLWNPAASGKVLILQKLSYYIQTAGPKYINFCHHNAACADGVLDMGNKYLGQAAGVGITRYSSGAALGTSIIRIYDIGSTLGAQWFHIPLRQAILIPEGIGLIGNTEIADVPMGVLWQWYEIDA